MYSVLCAAMCTSRYVCDTLCVRYAMCTIICTARHMCSRQCLCVQLYVRHAICAADNAYVHYDTSSCCWLCGPLSNDMCLCLYWLLDFTTLVVNVGTSRDHMTNLLGPHRSPDHKSGLWPPFVATAGRILPYTFISPADIS